MEREERLVQKAAGLKSQFDRLTTPRAKHWSALLGAAIALDSPELADDALLNIRRAATLVHKTERTIRNWIVQGLPATETVRGRMVKRGDLLKWAKRMER